MAPTLAPTLTTPPSSPASTPPSLPSKLEVLVDTLLLAKLLGSLSRWKALHIFVNHQTAQAKSVEDDIEVMEHIYQAKRHVSSFSSILAQFNLCAGSAGTRPPRLLSGGSRRAPTSTSTSTRLSPSLFRCCTDVFSAHHLRLNSDMQELPYEVKEEYLRRATLLLENFGHAHVSPAGGQHAGQVGKTR